MTIKGVDIQRGAIGAAINDNADSISALLVNGPAVVADVPNGIAGISLGQVVKLTSRIDAASYGIDAAYDAANNVRVFRHIDEFFRLAGEGTYLYLQLYTGTPVDALGDTYAKALIAQSFGEIRQLSLAYNPPTGYTPVLVDGLEENIRLAIPAAQLFYEWTFETFRPCQVIVEGRGFSAVSAATALDLRAITVATNIMEYTKVSLCIAQDWTYAETLDAIGEKMADVGTMLGAVAKLPVHRNIGEVETMNITDTVKQDWLIPGLSNHSKITDWDAQLEGLDAKGYCLVIAYTGYAGHYFNDDHTCTPVVIDAEGVMNESSISLGRVHDKACRVLRTSLLPKVKTTQPVDSTTGKLPSGIVKYFEGIGDAAFDTQMAGEISIGKTTVDPNSDLLTPPKELKASFVVVPQGQIGVIRGIINLKKQA